jgi:hypothetical protein
MTRVRYILVAAFALAVIVYAVVALWPPAPGVTQANFDRIKDGMTLAEVEAIYGKPSSNSFLVPFGEPFSVVHSWVSPSGNTAFVHISENVVVYKSWPEADETTLRKVRRWLFPPAPPGSQH